MAYESAETVLDIYADLGEASAIYRWAEEIVNELQYCTDGAPETKTNDCLICESDVRGHIDQGFEILKDMFASAFGGYIDGE